jgi:hypothetical protein
MRIRNPGDRAGAFMLVFAFHMPGIVQRGNGLRRRAKLCLGLCALSSAAIDNEVRLWPVLRIRDVYPGSRIRIFSILDPGSKFIPSRIRITEFKYLSPNKIVSKLSEI